MGDVVDPGLELRREAQARLKAAGSRISCSAPAQISAHQAVAAAQGWRLACGSLGVRTWLRHTSRTRAQVSGQPPPAVGCWRTMPLSRASALAVCSRERSTARVAHQVHDAQVECWVR